ncbi:hypothetical protein KO361_00230 [Candidatus Woesearchaeota archaeon]|nr:hypothetical protein [Candidatus Woesearchaeota archaeon]
MKTKKTIFITIIISIVLVMILSQNTEASILGVNRARLNFENVLRGGYAEQQITVSMGSERAIQVFYEAKGEIADWITLEPRDEHLIVTENNPGIINVIVEPPSDARVDTYEGTIIISTGPVGEITSQIGTNIVVAFEVKITVTITDTQIISCTAGGINLDTIEINEENTITATIRNTGNVRIRPLFEMKIFSQLQEQLIKEHAYRHDAEIIPTKTEIINNKINLGLEPGQYWAEITEPICGNKATITFSVLERGGISDEGNLITLRTKTWATTNEIVPITAKFKNQGTRTVSAQFKGVILKDGKIIKIIESETINVPRNEEIDIEMFYTPEEPGQYQVKGRIHYNQKVTQERGTIINVNTETKTQKTNTNIVTLTYSIIIITITTLLFLILRKKKKKKRKKNN